MNPAFTIKTLSSSPETISSLTDLLVEVVANGGSVSFLHPLAPEKARAFWEASLAAADLGERVILGAFDKGELVSTLTLLLDCPQNQLHRAEIAKMMTSISHRSQGIARSLVREAERIAIAHGKTLLNLDTAADEGAAGFYERLGFQRAGEIPDYAFKPLGGLTATIIYWKRIGRG